MQPQEKNEHLGLIVEAAINTIGLFWNVFPALPALARSWYEPKFHTYDEVLQAVEWEADRQNIQADRITLCPNTTQPLSEGQAEKISERHYAIHLTLPTNIVTIRHELRHIVKGHTENRPQLNDWKKRIKLMITQEPLTYLYSAFGPSYKAANN